MEWFKKIKGAVFEEEPEKEVPSVAPVSQPTESTNIIPSSGITVGGIAVEELKPAIDEIFNIIGVIIPTKDPVIAAFVEKANTVLEVDPDITRAVKTALKLMEKEGTPKEAIKASFANVGNLFAGITAEISRGEPTRLSHLEKEISDRIESINTSIEDLKARLASAEAAKAENETGLAQLLHQAKVYDEASKQAVAQFTEGLKKFEQAISA